VPSPDLTRLSLVRAGELLRRREISPVELLDAVLARIARLDGRLNSFTTLAPAEEARAAARAAEREIAAGGWRGPLHGVPVSVKDLIDTAGIRTTYGSAMFRDHVPAADGAVPERLRAAGAVLVGKTATHELGRGITTNNHFFGPTLNPWNLAHVPGGSSGGAGAAAAACLGPLHVGTDSGGSIRFPAAWCGVVGLKPTLGLVSNRGQFGGGDTSFSTPGPLARSVGDAALAAQALAGFDPAYAWSRPDPPPDLLDALEAGVAGLRVATSPDLLEPAPDPPVAAALAASVACLVTLGAVHRELRFPHHGLVPGALASIFATEGEVGFARLLGDRPRILSPQLERMAALMPAADVETCVRLQHERQLVRRDWEAAFTEADVVLMPAAPITAPRLDAEEWSYVMRCLPYSGAANLTGLPAVVLPAGFADGLPIGLQILAPAGADALALRVARALERAAPEHRVSTPPDA
jgi:aspartyl-tRNA(Asn)/glutamyl-tRNA(Gln) amidotransferase subunit A